MLFQTRLFSQNLFVWRDHDLLLQFHAQNQVCDKFHAKYLTFLLKELNIPLKVRENYKMLQHNKNKDRKQKLINPLSLILINLNRNLFL